MFIVDHHVEISAPGHVTKLRAPYAVLAQLLGPPSDDGPEKCSTLWAFRGERDRSAVWLKDWQDEDDASFRVDVFRARPSYDWDVWAGDEETASAFCRWLSARVIARLGQVKTLSAEGKAELNGLIKSGVPLAEALKRVPTQAPADLAVRFGWPIADRD